MKALICLYIFRFFRTGLPKYNQIKIIGVHAGNMFSRNGEKINNSYTREGYAAALNLDRRTKAVLEFYVKDKTLEGFWDKRKSIYPVLKELAFSAVIAPNYSVYEDAPRVDHMYNIKRSMIVYNELLESGIPAVPDVSWYNKSDLDRWCGEINKNNIKVIAFLFQFPVKTVKRAFISCKMRLYPKCHLRFYIEIFRRQGSKKARIIGLFGLDIFFVKHSCQCFTK